MALGTTGLSARNNLCSPIRMPLTSSISSNSEASSTSISRNSAGTCSGKRLFVALRACGHTPRDRRRDGGGVL